MKKSVKLVLFALLFLFMTVSVLGEEISDLAQITDLDGTYELTKDIAVPENFTPIGSEENPFTGTFDGKDFTITLSGASSLFGCVADAEINNVRVEGLIDADSVFGGVVALAKGSTVISGCTFKGSVDLNLNDTYVIGGGIAGLVDKKAVIENCSAEVNLTVSKTPYLFNFGGIAGENLGSISLCNSDGKFTCSSDKYKINIGGIAGTNYGKLSGCFNQASIIGSLAAESSQLCLGGIAGTNDGGTIERCANLGVVCGTGIAIYPVYVGGIAGINVNGSIKITKNSAGLSVTRAFAGGIAGYSIGNSGNALVENSFNMGSITKLDSLAGGITAWVNTTAAKDSLASVSYALNVSGDAAVAKNSGSYSDIYSTGVSDGVSVLVTADELKKNGIPQLENTKDFWVNNSDISALPDLLVVYNPDSAELVASNKGEENTVAYYLYSPYSGTYAKAFTAVYYNGDRYLGMSYTEKTPDEKYARLTADKIPENTTRIKLIAFAETFGTIFKPSEIKSVEFDYNK